MSRAHCPFVFEHLARRRDIPRRIVAGLSVVIALLGVGPAHAAWQPDGVKISPPIVDDPDRTDSYQFRDLLADGAGGAYFTWFHDSYFYPADVGGGALVAQRVDMLGNRPAPWPASGVNILGWTTSSPFGVYSAFPVALVDDGAGGAVHALVSQSLSVEPHSNFNLHHVLPNASVTGFPFFSGDFQGGSPLGVAVDGDQLGGVVHLTIGQTFSQPPGPPPPSPLYARHIDGNGNVLWENYDVTGAGLAAGGLAALSDGAGGGWFAWTDTREAGDPDVYVQRLDATGAPAPGFVAGGLLVCGAGGGQFDVRLARDGAGGVFVIWRDDRTGNSILHATRVLAGGGIAPGIPADGQPIATTATSDVLINLDADGAGGLFVVHSGATGVSFLLRLDGSLLSRPGWGAAGVQLHTLPPSWGQVGLAADGSGGAYVSYRNGFGVTPPQGLHAQHYAGDGTIAPGWNPGGYRLSGFGGPSKLVLSGMGAIVVWDDFRPTPPHRGIYAQRIVTDGPVAVNMALVSAAVVDGRVALHWHGAGAAGQRFTIERTTEAGWAPIAEIDADGAGHVRHEDAGVGTGQRYGYRLTWNESGERYSTIATYVDVPRDVMTLAIESPRPSPSKGAVSLAITLSDARTAKLDVLDLAGRRVAGRDLTGLGPGRHVVEVQEIESLSSGLYVVQVSQAGETRRTRLMRVN